MVSLKLNPDEERILSVGNKPNDCSERLQPLPACQTRLYFFRICLRSRANKLGPIIDICSILKYQQNMKINS